MGKAAEAPSDGTIEYANKSFNTAIDNMQWMYASAQLANNQASNTALTEYNNGRQAFQAASQPFLHTATHSTDELSRYLGLADSQGNAGYTGAEAKAALEATPGYQFTVDQGNQAVNRTASAAGMLSSGNALLAAQKFGQDAATQNYQSHIGNLQNLSNSMQPYVQANLSNIASTTQGKANILQNQGNVGAQLFANQGNQLQTAYTQKGTSNLAYAMQQNQLASQASQNNAVGAGAMAGLNAGYLRGSF